MDKSERLLNLIALLLNTRRPIPIREIRKKIPGYGSRSDETFHRMFERDKEEIRDLGYTLAAEDADAWGETGYRIRTEDALLGDVGLTPDEMAALSLASQAWGGDGTTGVMKLSVASTAAERAPAGWLVPRVSLDPNVGTLLDAIGRRKSVRFRYRSGGGGEPHERGVDPYGLVYRGTWYLTAFDRDRGEVRHFRLSRIEGRLVAAGGVKPDFDMPAIAADGVHAPWEGEPRATARVRFAPDAAWQVERRTGAERVSESADGWATFEIPVAEISSFAGWLAGFGETAVAESPPELVDSVVARLRASTGEG